MADGRISSTGTDVPLSKGPADMPDRGKTNPQIQSTSSSYPINRGQECPVAAFGAHPNQGTIQSTGTDVPLTKKESSPYGDFSRTKEQFSLGGGKKGK